MDQPADGAHQLCDLVLRVGRRFAFALHAVMRMGVQKAERDLVQGGLGGSDLRQDVDAVPILFDHSSNATNLALGAREALENLVLGGAVPAAHDAARRSGLDIGPPWVGVWDD
jgi:hypothetical protein